MARCLHMGVTRIVIRPVTLVKFLHLPHRLDVLHSGEFTTMAVHGTDLPY